MTKKNFFIFRTRRAPNRDLALLNLETVRIWKAVEIWIRITYFEKFGKKNALFGCFIICTRRTVRILKCTAKFVHAIFIFHTHILQSYGLEFINGWQLGVYYTYGYEMIWYHDCQCEDIMERTISPCGIKSKSDFVEIILTTVTLLLNYLLLFKY